MRPSDSGSGAVGLELEVENYPTGVYAWIVSPARLEEALLRQAGPVERTRRTAG
jgi:hypothetical protein